MRDRSIRVEPFEFISLLACDIFKPLNDHLTAKVKGHISGVNKEKYYSLPVYETAVRIISIDESGEETTLFHGILRDLRLHHENGLNTLEVDLVSYSYLMDLKEQVRVFQNIRSTYTEVLEYLAQPGPDGSMPYPAYALMMHVPEAQEIGDLLVQYQETDWQFAKRLASHFRSYLVPDAVVGGVKYYFGKPELPIGKIGSDIDFATTKSLSEYIIKDSECSDLGEDESISYVLKHRDVFELTQPIMFRGRSLFVYQVESHLDGKELVHTYTLRSEKGFDTPRYDNSKIVGVALGAKVGEIDKELVQILVHEDGIQDMCKWLVFATVYATPDGAGWYFMPEQGDAVRLYFPNEKESAGYVISATHLPVAAGRPRVTPEHKILMNTHGKEVRLTPDSLLLTNNTGMSVELVDGQGITIKSNKNISLIAEEDIALASVGAGIEIAATAAVHVQQNTTQVDLQGQVVTAGLQVHTQNGSGAMTLNYVGTDVRRAVGTGFYVPENTTTQILD